MVRGSANDRPISYEHLSGEPKLTNGEIIIVSDNFKLLKSGGVKSFVASKGIMWIFFVLERSPW